MLALHLGPSFLFTSMVVQGICANIFILKEISLFGLSVTGTDAFMIGIILAINLLEEFYGTEASQKAISNYIFSMFLLLPFKFIHLWYNPTASDTTDPHFQEILASSGRIILSTLIASFISLKLDRKLYQILSLKLGSEFLIMKNFITTTISQFIDTILFSYLALWGIFSNLWELIIFSYAIKLISILLTSIILTTIRFFTAFKIYKNFIENN